GVSITKNGTSYTDTLGIDALNFTTALPPTTSQYYYQDSAGNNQYVKVAYTTKNFHTIFGCPYIADVNSPSYYWPTTVSLPAGTIGITYEAPSGYPNDTTGRIASITLPTGGTITYSYSGGNSGIDCASGVVPTLKQTINDNNRHVSTWTYVNTNNTATSNPSYYTTTATDPANNQTVYYFVNQYQTEAQVYQGG